MATCNESGRYGLWILLLGVWILVGCTTSNSLPDVEELSALDEALTEENQEGAVGGHCPRSVSFRCLGSAEGCREEEDFEALPHSPSAPHSSLNSQPPRV